MTSTAPTITDAVAAIPKRINAKIVSLFICTAPAQASSLVTDVFFRHHRGHTLLIEVTITTGFVLFIIALAYALSRPYLTQLDSHGLIFRRPPAIQTALFIAASLFLAQGLDNVIYGPYGPCDPGFQFFFNVFSFGPAIGLLFLTLPTRLSFDFAQGRVSYSHLLPPRRSDDVSIDTIDRIITVKRGSANQRSNAIKVRFKDGRETVAIPVSDQWGQTQVIAEWLANEVNVPVWETSSRV